MAAHVQGGPLRVFLSRRGKVVTGIILLLVLFLVRPGAQRLHTRIVRSISLALGRQVDVGSVSLRLLPQPGFELENFVVHEDPAFGAEPVLQSSDVVALVRVRSLLRGRLEISRLSLTDPSINLVRNSEGSWNLENLLERAARMPVAPTAKPKGEPRPGFPYIEADHARINFKSGQEKKPYALTDAHFALWQDSENAWGVRLKAQPVRTDFNLSDTGLLEVDGSWQRAANIHQTPLQFTVQWEGAQLGQVTKLAMGQDKGWRGAIVLSASLTGTPEDLSAAADASVQNFRRYDITNNNALRLATHCTGHYSSSDHVLSQLACNTPVGDGRIAVNGRVTLPSAARAYDLALLAQNLPVQPLVEFARRVKQNVPADIIATGKLNAGVTLHREANGTGPIWEGEGDLVGLNVRSALNNSKLALERIPFTVSSGIDPTFSGSQAGKNRRAPVVARVDVGPFTIPLGRPANTTLHGQFSRSGYALIVQGDTEIQRLLDLARMAGLPTPQLASTGEARVNLRVGGSWVGFAPPVVTGTAQLSAVHSKVRGLIDPVEVTSASLSLAPDVTEVQKLTMVAAGNTWRGSFTIPRGCNTPHTCPIHFDLHSDEIVADAFGAATAVSAKQPWYRFLSQPAQASSAQSPNSQSSASQSSFGQSRPYLASVHAIGRLTAGRVLINNLIASHVSADAELEQGHLVLSSLRGEVLGGRHTGKWSADFNTSPPSYSGDGTLERVSLEQLAEAMHDGWITGTANAEYRANTLGWGKTELLSGATASVQVEAQDASLPHLRLAGETNPLRVMSFVGRLHLLDGKFDFEKGKLQTPASIYQLSGTASLSRVLDLKLTREGAHGFNITGTLTEPHVVMNTTPDTQAALKP
jgi:AsmA family/AsmA-like C-terminal region